MRQTYTMEEIAGLNLAFTIGTTIKDNWNFVRVGVAVGDVVENKSLGTSGTVSSVDTNELGTDVTFNVGDAYIVTLATEWDAVTYCIDGKVMGPVYEGICGLCGFECSKEELESHDGRCKECYDPPHPLDQGR